MKLLPTVFLMTFSASLNSQSLANYTSSRNTSVPYNSISLTGNSIGSWRNTTNNTQDDNRSDFTDIGFDFWYDGTRYKQFCVSTNGFVDFSSSTDDGGPQADNFGYSNVAFTTANAANATRPAVAPFYDDLTAQGGTAALGNSIKYLLTGSAPNRTLTIEWINMAVYQNTSPSLNFQVQLVENSGRIIVNYGVMNSGTNVFSYSMGMNGPTISNTPTSAQLKMLQTVNTNNFSNTVQNGLSAMPTSNSQYIYIPPVPTATSGGLSFTGVTQTGMTLNWTNWATNEIGYVIYQSTDGVNYSFASQTAANATSSSFTGLLPSTVYYWKLYAVTEGALSAAISGSQSTSSAGNKVSVTSGNWNTASTWSPTGIPVASDNVVIANGHEITIASNSQCNNLTIGQGILGSLQFTTGLARTLSVNNNIIVNTGAAFLVSSSSTSTHSLFVQGNIVNNGTINFANGATALANVTFTRNGNQSISGSGAVNKYNLISVDVGSAANTMEINSSNFSAATGFLTLTNGVFKMSTVNNVSITPFSNAVSLNSNCKLWLNSSNLTVNTGASVSLYGDIAISSGTLNVGDAQDEDIIANGGSIVISGGVLNIAGKLDGSGINNTCDFNLNGGVVTVPAVGSSNTSVAPFHINGAGSTCNMTGGLLVIQRSGGTGTQNLGFTNIGSSGAIVTGGTLQIGNSSTPANQTIDINTDSQINHLVINSANVVGRLNTNSLNVRGNVSINSGTMNANNLGLSLLGNWINNSVFIPGTGTVTLNGTSSQYILKSGTETFNNLIFTGSGIKTFSCPVNTNSNFSIAVSSSVDISASNQSLSIKGNFINNGTFNARNGLITLNGTTTQTIGGSSTCDFYDLTLNNTVGAILTHAENLKGSLTLSNGTFNANGQVLTLVSDASGTGRIAAITGTGDYIGNITIQRYVPGGSTGWALLGSPISSALTFADWDDDIYISCPTCPDGSAGGFLSIYSYSEAVNGVYDSPNSYIPLSSINNPISSGKGYWVYHGTSQYTTTAVTIDLTGTPRKSNYVIPLSYTNHGSANDDGWNLICNPYPSAISWTALKGSTSNIDNAIYVYNADLNGGLGAYASYVNGISSPALASGGIGNVIPMGQGFYVHSTGATALTAQESNKVAGNPTFLKVNDAASQIPLMRINLKSFSGGMDETVLYFDQDATSQFDDFFDAYKMNGQDPLAPYIALSEGGKYFQINGVAPVSTHFTTYVRAITGYSGMYTINVSDFSGFSSDAEITLYDRFTATSTDLRKSQASFYLSDTTTVDRFILNISFVPLSVDAKSKSNDNWLIKNMGEGKYVVFNDNAEGESYNLTLYDTQGRVITNYGEVNSIPLDVNVNLEKPGVSLLLLKSKNYSRVFKLIQ